MSEPLCWLNGKLVPLGQARISPLDRGLLYGDGLFETMRAYHGGIFRLVAHLERLLAGARALRFPFALDAGELARACEDTVRANGLREAYVRLTVTRGVGGLPSELDASPEPTVLVVAREFHGYPAELRERGMRAVIAPVRRNASSPLARVKSLNYLDSLLARAWAADSGADEALMLDPEGSVVEGSASNLFVVEGGAVGTPPVSAGVLPGITRECVLGLCADLGIEAGERTITPDDLTGADEAFLTNSLMEVMPLTRVGGLRMGEGRPGALTGRLLQAYRDLVADEAGDPSTGPGAATEAEV